VQFININAFTNLYLNLSITKNKIKMFFSNWMITYSRTKVRKLKIFKIYFSTGYKDDYSKEILKTKTIVEMRALAKRSQINLKGAKKKDKIINIILAHFLYMKTSEITFEVIDKSFKIVTNDLGYINVSIWFKGKPKSLKRCMETKRFQKLLAEYIKKEPNNVSIQQGDDNAIFLPPVLSVFIASYLSYELDYEILEYYLSSRASHIEAVYGTKIKLDINKINRRSWVNFEAPFAYYWFIIGNTLKCGAVGIKGCANRDNLKARLSKHRSTHAKLVLLGAIKFKDSQTVTLFENWMKIVLLNYSIDSADKALIEQYESTQVNIKETVGKLILKQFSVWNAEANGLGVYCSQDLINLYNEVSNERLK
jgi:hypothetical protein